MSTTTIVETTPVWVYKLLSDGERKGHSNYSVINPQISKGNKLSDNFEMGTVYQMQPATSSVGQVGHIANSKLDFFCQMLSKIREPIAIYEEQRGIPRDAEHTFFGIVTALAQNSYQALITIFTMLINLWPLFEGFLVMFRFVLDKSIDICHTPDKKEQVLKLIVFAGELVVMFLMVLMIIGIIILPVYHLISFTIYKLWAAILNH